MVGVCQVYYGGCLFRPYPSLEAFVVVVGHFSDQFLKWLATMSG
jgi:hypothetical protein